METNVRISLTPGIGADHSTHQILDNRMLLSTEAQCRLYTYESTEDCLYKLMETYDGIDSFSIFVDSLDESMHILEFLRDQNPRKEIRVYCIGADAEGEAFSSASPLLAQNGRLCGALAEEDGHSLFEVIDRLCFIK